MPLIKCDFQEYYLSYIINRTEKSRKNALINVFFFNNERINKMNNSLNRRTKMRKTMIDLQEMLSEWDDKLGLLILDEKEAIKNKKSKDIQNEEQFKSKIIDLKSRSLIPPFISIDQEGGRVERTENIREKRLSAKYAFQNGKDFLKKQSEEISKELANWGVNLNFAPCIDVNTNPNNPIIGERAFSDKVEEVMQIAMDPISLDKPVGDEDDSIVADFIADQNVISPETNAERVMLKEQIKETQENLFWSSAFINKIVEGKVRKALSEVCLLEQDFIKDPDKTVQQVLTEKISKELISLGNLR